MIPFIATFLISTGHSYESLDQKVEEAKNLPKNLKLESEFLKNDSLSKMDALVKYFLAAEGVEMPNNSFRNDLRRMVKEGKIGKEHYFLFQELEKQNKNPFSKDLVGRLLSGKISQGADGTLLKQYREFKEMDSCNSLTREREATFFSEIEAIKNEYQDKSEELLSFMFDQLKETFDDQVEIDLEKENVIVSYQIKELRNVAMSLNCENTCLNESSLKFLEKYKSIDLSLFDENSVSENIKKLGKQINETADLIKKLQNQEKSDGMILSDNGIISGSDYLKRIENAISQFRSEFYCQAPVQSISQVREKVETNPVTNYVQIITPPSVVK